MLHSIKSKYKFTVNWIKTLLRVVRTFDLRFEGVHDRIASAERFIRERTEVNVDLSVNPKDANTVVVIGRYKTRDYVEIFSMHGDNFAKLVGTLKEMSRYYEVNRVDCPHHMRYFVDDQLRGL